MLNCGHSYCENCLRLLYKPANKQLQCPSCLASHDFEKVEDLSRCIKNYTLLQIIEAAKFGNTPTPTAASGASKGGGLIKSKTTTSRKRPEGSGAFSQELDGLEESKSLERRREEGEEESDEGEEYIEEDEDGN